MKKSSSLMLRATALGVVILISGCGGGDGGSGGSSGNGGGTANPGTGGTTPPATGGSGTTPITPGTPTSVFTPAADDLPTTFDVDYPNQTSAVTLNIDYVETKLPAAPPYINSSSGQCSSTLDLVS